MRRYAALLLLLLTMFALVPALLLSTSSAQAQTPEFGIDTFRTANPGLDYVILADITSGGSDTPYARDRFGNSGTATSDSDLNFLADGLADSAPLILVHIATRDGHTGGSLKLNHGGGSSFIFSAWLSGGGQQQYSVHLMLASGPTATHSFALADTVRSSGGGFVNLNVPTGPVQQVWGGLSTGDRFVLAIARTPPANEPPSFPATTYTRNVDENATSGTLLGDPIAATDPDDGDTLAYSLSGTGSSLFAVSSTGQISVAAGASLDHESTDSYTLTLTATDSASLPASGTTTVTVTVRDLNEAPVFPDATYTRNVNENSTAGTAVGAAVTATDPDDQESVSYSLSGTGADLFTVSSTGQVTVATGADLNHETTASYSLTVTATDGSGLTGTASVTITIGDVNEVPSIPESSYTRSVNENTTTGTALGAAIAATDPDDRDTLRYSLSGTRSGDFLVSNSGQITVAAALDHETTASYSLTLTVRDSGALTDTASVSVTVNDLNERPSFAESGYTGYILDMSVAGTPVGNPIVATDPDDQDTVRYTLSGSGASRFIVDANGQITAAGVIRFSDGSSYTLTLTATDTGGLTAAATVNIIVTDLNEAPVFAETVYSRSVDENSAPGTTVGGPIAATDGDLDTLTYSLGGTGSDLFAVSGTGQITVATGTALNHEATGSYSLTLTATDDATLPLSDTATVNITVNDVNEPPAFRLATYTRTVSIRAQVGDRVDNPVTATDPDDGDSVSYSLSGSNSDAFTVNSSGQVTVSSSGLVSGVGSYDITVTAIDSGGLASTARVVITVRDDNNAPRFPQSLYTRTVDDGTPSGRSVGAPVVAQDPDGDALRYSLSGPGNNNFSVDSSGQMSTASVIHHSSTSRYNLTLTATDPHGGTATTNVRITVSRPPPSIGSVSASLEGHEATVTVTVANPTGTHTVYMRHRVGRSSWTTAQPQTTTSTVAFTITGLAAGQDYRVEASLDSSFAVSGSATFQVPRPGSEPLRESLDFVVSVVGGVATVDPTGFTFFGVDYEVVELMQESGEITMVLRGLCPASWKAESLTIGSTELVPSQSCTDTNELSLGAQAQAGTLVDGASDPGGHEPAHHRCRSVRRYGPPARHPAGHHLRPAGQHPGPVGLHSHHALRPAAGRCGVPGDRDGSLQPHGAQRRWFRHDGGNGSPRGARAADDRGVHPGLPRRRGRVPLDKEMMREMMMRRATDVLRWVHRHGSYDPKAGVLAVLLGVVVSVAFALGLDFSIVSWWQPFIPPAAMVVLGVLVILHCPDCLHEEEANDDA